MSKLLKNTTASPIVITDTGVTIPPSPGTYLVPAQDYLLWAASSNVITYIGSGALIVNDGSLDLNISDGTDLIKGLFPKKILPVAVDPDTGVYVDNTADGIVSDNSSTALLGVGGVFTGAWRDCSGYVSIAFLVQSDVAAAALGVIIQFSHNGSTITKTTGVDYPGVFGSFYVFASQAKYFRLVYTNGSVAQSTFTIQTRLAQSFLGDSAFPVRTPLTDNATIKNTKSINVGKNPDGVYVNATEQGLHAGNTSTTPLLASAIYRGLWFRWIDAYITITCSVQADTAGVFNIDASNADNPTDGVDTDVHFTSATTYNPAMTPVLRRNIPVQCKWVRLRYINGPAAQSFFNIFALFTTSDPGDTYSAATDLPILQTLVSINRSIQTIPNAAGTGYQEIPVHAVTGKPAIDINAVHEDLLLKPLTGASAEQINVGTTATRLDPFPITNRRSVLLSNDGPSACAVGFSNTITFDSNSFRMVVGAVRILPFKETVQLWAIAQNSGGIQTTLTRSGSSASGTAASPSNALTSNDVYSDITANAQTISVVGFTAGTTNPLVSVKLGLEAKKQAGQFQTVAHVATVTGNAGNVGSVATTTPVTAVTGQLYIAAISRENVNALVTGISGLGLSWTQLSTIPNAANRRLDIWYAIGTVSTTNIVTAALSNTATNAHIAISRYSGVDLSTPIQAFITAIGNSSTPTTAGIAGTNKGMAYMAVAKDNTIFTQGAGYTLASDETTPAGANRDGLGTEYKSLISTGTEVPSGITSGGVQWAAISLTMTPAVAPDPDVTLSYLLSLVAGATSGVVTVLITTDTQYFVDITSDRAWVAGDIPNITAIATGSAVGASAANVDHLFVQIVDTTGNTTKISVLQGGEALAL